MIYSEFAFPPRGRTWIYFPLPSLPRDLIYCHPATQPTNTMRRLQMLLLLLPGD
jgi:hypothetical protein